MLHKQRFYKTKSSRPFPTWDPPHKTPAFRRNFPTKKLGQGDPLPHAPSTWCGRFFKPIEVSTRSLEKNLRARVSQNEPFWTKWNFKDLSLKGVCFFNMEFSTSKIWWEITVSIMTCLPNMSPQKSVKVADSRLLILSMDISKFGKKRPGFHLVFAMKKTSRTVGRKMITKKGACGMVKRQHKNNGCTYTYKKNDMSDKVCKINFTILFRGVKECNATGMESWNFKKDLGRRTFYGQQLHTRIGFATDLWCKVLYRIYSNSGDIKIC